MKVIIDYTMEGSMEVEVPDDVAAQAKEEGEHIVGNWIEDEFHDHTEQEYKDGLHGWDGIRMKKWRVRKGITG